MSLGSASYSNLDRLEFKGYYVAITNSPRLHSNLDRLEFKVRIALQESTRQRIRI